LFLVLFSVILRKRENRNKNQKRERERENQQRERETKRGGGGGGGGKVFISSVSHRGSNESVIDSKREK
jgi:hypothetical protein